jgi:Na+-transporting NADH:ubiquinone oxidoreductase subunit B
VIAEFLEKIRPHFQKGGRLEKLYPVYEATDTFLFTAPKVTKHGTHVRDSLDTKRYMSMVIVALLPTVFMGAWNAGYQHLITVEGADTGFFHSMELGLWYIVPMVVTSYAVGGAWEVLFAAARRHEINEGFLVTGLLFPLTCPPDLPLWMVAVGISFGVVIGKEVFGGTGMNIFNPALTARVFVFFAYPAYISGDLVWAVANYPVDGVTGATPLLYAKSGAAGASATQLLSSIGQQFPLMDYSFWNCVVGFIPGSIGETSFLACLLGAALLIATGIGSWRIMSSMALGGVGMALVMNQFAGPDRNPILSLPPHWHLVTGSFAFGAIFMATDPVSGTVTDVGKWIYGALIGVLTILIRTVNPAYPEGVMLAILFMNVFAPTIDYLVVQANVRKRRLAHAK